MTSDFPSREQGDAGWKGGKQAEDISPASFFPLCRSVSIKRPSDNQADETHFYSADRDC